jgi:LuxR family transcriptional regulator, maltose regulon positive regulatory protein
MPGQNVPSRGAGTRHPAVPRTTRRARGPLPFVREPRLDVIEAKIRPPAPRRGVVTRATLVNRLRREKAAVVLLIARAGYGKTTLLVQWAAVESRPVAWVSIDSRDNDPLVLVKHVVAAVDRIQPLDPRVLASLSVVRKQTWMTLAGRAARSVASCGRPFLLVLDNADLLHASEARRLLSMLIAAVPQGSTVAIAARTTPKVPAAALRARGRVLELGAAELALSSREAQLLLQRANADLTAEETADLIALCEGWPAALYLASLSLRDLDRGPGPNRFAGSDRYLADYMRTEYLSLLPPRDLRFLRRAAILEELTAPLCDAVLQTQNSEAELRKLARAGIAIVPLDGKPGRFRLHRLFRDLLLRELVEEEPKLIPSLHKRAANWYEKAGAPAHALEHASAAGDTDRVAAIITTTAFSASARGYVLDLERSLARFDTAGQLERYPSVAVHGSRLHAYRGRLEEAERWLAAAERGRRRRGGDPAALRPQIAVVRAALCREGPRRMLADAGGGMSKLARRSQWYPAAVHMRGTAALLLGARDEARALLAEAARAAAALRCPETQMIAISQLSLITRERDDSDRADALSDEAWEIASQTDLDGYPTSAIALAAAAHSSLRHGRWAEARELIGVAEPLSSSLTASLPWLAVETRLELARCFVTLRDGEAARLLAEEVDAIIEVRPRLGLLVDQARALRHELQTLAHPSGALSVLTPAELRLLPLLATHLAFREIAEQLKISRNTVKTQAISIYRKLGVSGRSEAIKAAMMIQEPADVVVHGGPQLSARLKSGTERV